MPKKIRRKSSENENREKLIRMLKFLIKLNILAIPIWLIVVFNFQVPVLKEITAGIVYYILKFLGIDATLSGTLLSIPAEGGNFAVNLNWVCVGWESMYIFFALVFATDFELRKKIKGMVFLPLIYFINILRIVSVLLLVNMFGSGWFDVLHIGWTFAFALIILIFWWVWMKKV